MRERDGEGAKYLDRAEDGVRLARQPDDYGPLLNRLGGIFDLEDAALRRASRGLASEREGNPGALPQQNRRKGDRVQGDRVVVVVVPEHYEVRAVASLSVGFEERRCRGGVIGCGRSGFLAAVRGEAMEGTVADSLL